MERRNSRTSVYLALGVVVAVSLWMLSGLGSEPAPQASAVEQRSIARAELPNVRSMRSTAVEVRREIVVSGRTQANRTLELRAETDGPVVGIHVERGASV